MNSKGTGMTGVWVRLHPYSNRYDGIIPALDVGIQGFFEHESYAKFLLVSKGWIPVSVTGMTGKGLLE